MFFSPCGHSWSDKSDNPSVKIKQQGFDAHIQTGGVWWAFSPGRKYWFVPKPVLHFLIIGRANHKAMEFFKPVVVHLVVGTLALGKVEVVGSKGHGRLKCQMMQINMK